MPRPNVPDAIASDLFERVTSAVKAGDVVYTVAQHRPNAVVHVSREGVYVETEGSRKQGSGPQLVPVWMFNYAWQELRRTGGLTSEKLVVFAKRSSAVCAILARLAGVKVTSTRPIALSMVDRAGEGSAV